MPMYEFNCKKHGKFEKIVPYDTGCTICPECHDEHGKKTNYNHLALRIDEPELPARRNPAYGIQR